MRNLYVGIGLLVASISSGVVAKDYFSVLIGKHDSGGNMPNPAELKPESAWYRSCVGSESKYFEDGEFKLRICFN